MGKGAATIYADGETSKLYMQDMVASQCTEDGVTVYDKRDEKHYLVKKLADGNCWLLDNLRLDPTAVDLATLQGNTNASDQTLDYFINGGRDAGDKYPTAGLANWTSGYSYSQPLTNAASKDTTVTSSGSGSGKVGVYYNYCAATTGSYCYGNDTSAGTSVGDAGEDICPAGWRMPTGGANTVTTDGKGEYQALYTAYSSNVTNFKTALSTPLSGYFDYGSAIFQGSRGSFWSSTKCGDTTMFYLRVDSSSVYPQTNNSRYSGYSVRCLLK